MPATHRGIAVGRAPRHCGPLSLWRIASRPGFMQVRMTPTQACFWRSDGKQSRSKPGKPITSNPSITIWRQCISCLVHEALSFSKATAGACRTPITRFRSCPRGSTSEVKAVGYAIEASNHRHEHEWRVREDVKFLEGKRTAGLGRE